MKWYYEDGVGVKPYPTIFGYRRRNVLILFAILFTLILIIGLAVGITQMKRHLRLLYHCLVANVRQNLPLPGDTGGIYSGDLTYYAPGLGSCGITNSDTDMICAISHELYGFDPSQNKRSLLLTCARVDSSQTGTNPNSNPFCMRKIRATRHRNGVDGNVSVDVTVVDRCTGCKLYDLDFSPGAFHKMADESLGRVDVTWAFLN